MSTPNHAPPTAGPVQSADRRTLHIFQPLENSATDPAESAAECRPDLASINAKIDALRSLLERATVPSSAASHRTLGPVRCTLRQCFDSAKQRNFARREPATWDDYESVVDKLEQVWSGPGPDVRTLTSTSLQAAFEAVTTWRNLQTWAQHRKYLLSILRDCCRQSSRNPFGLPRGESPLLTEDEIPVWELPSPKWFASRGAAPRVKLPALTIEEFDRVLLACDGATNDPLWWRTLLSFWFFCAMRRTDTLDHLRWYSETTRLGVDLTRRWLTWRAAKTQEEFDIPLPEWLCVGLRALAERSAFGGERKTAEGGHPPGGHSAEGGLVFYRPMSDSNLARWLYSPLRAICRHAGVAYRDPTGFRQSSMSHWDVHDPQLTNRFSAHRESSIVKSHYIVANEAQLRAAADRHPRPSIALDAPPQNVLF